MATRAYVSDVGLQTDSLGASNQSPITSRHGGTSVRQSIAVSQPFSHQSSRFRDISSNRFCHPDFHHCRLARAPPPLFALNADLSQNYELVRLHGELLVGNDPSRPPTIARIAPKLIKQLNSFGSRCSINSAS